MQHLTPDAVREMVISGHVPDEEFFVDGDLDLSSQQNLTTLPDTFRGAWGLNLEGCKNLTNLPPNLDVKRLNLNDCESLQILPAGLKSYEIQAQRSGLREIADDIEVDYRLDLTDCRDLVRLPNNLHVGSLMIKGCTALESLPDGLHLYFLDASGCVNLRRWGKTGSVEVGNINLNGCGLLTYLPDWMGKIARLNIGGCANLHVLPDNMQVTSTIEMANSGLQSLPEACKNATLRWRDVEIDERIAFHPEDISAREVLNERNIERRRVMLERIGYETFFEQAHAHELDRDFDAGGVRQLLRVTFNDTNNRQRDEPLVCLKMSCPSTARQYVIRVPPSMLTCHHAAAWIAGFDNPDQYYPDMET
jgi:hypothetical protein